MSNIELVEDKPNLQMPVIMFDPQALISQAIEKGTSVDTMERLLAMFKDMAAMRAKNEYTAALALFQSKCPVIEKTKPVIVNGALRYKYAPLDSIISQVQGLIFECGFSYTIETVQKDNELTAICNAHHIGGHDAKSSFTVPIESNQYKTAPQHVGSARTYAMRYAFCDLFGIMTGDEDNDANNQEPVTVTRQEKKAPVTKPKQTKPTFIKPDTKIDGEITVDNIFACINKLPNDKMIGIAAKVRENLNNPEKLQSIIQEIKSILNPPIDQSLDNDADAGFVQEYDPKTGEEIPFQCQK